mgnify:CR=1 FL=1
MLANNSAFICVWFDYGTFTLYRRHSAWTKYSCLKKCLLSRTHCLCLNILMFSAVTNYEKILKSHPHSLFLLGLKQYKVMTKRQFMYIYILPGGPQQNLRVYSWAGIWSCGRVPPWTPAARMYYWYHYTMTTLNVQRSKIKQMFWKLFTTICKQPFGANFFARCFTLETYTFGWQNVYVWLAKHVRLAVKTCTFGWRLAFKITSLGRELTTLDEQRAHV